VDGVVAVAQAAERLGFHSVWTTDHVILPPDQAGPYAEILEPLLTLAYAASLTTRVRLGVSVVVVPQRNVVVLAKELATLDVLAKGRLDLGVGAGWSEDEFRMLGVGERFRYRGLYLDETLQLWRHLWNSPDEPFNGRFIKLPRAAFAPGPIQRPGPPIWVGGSSEGARRRAGLFGDVWHPVGITAQDMADLGTLVRETAASVGRAAPLFAPRLPVLIGGKGEAAVVGQMHVVAGSVEQVADEFRNYAAAGADEIVCLFSSPQAVEVISQMELLAGQVAPLLA
jgi:probable F420-dependent oxidoreductase